jgi:transcriptional regulator GlxA family with amidase domain
MKHLTILVPVGEQNLISVVGSYKIFKKANQLWEAKGKKAVFKIELASISKKVQFHEGVFFVRPHIHIDQLKKTDLILVPALASPNYSHSIRQNKELISWMEKQYKRGAEIASMCTGAFLLAATGILNGKGCSTHWAAATYFRELFPEVKLVTDKIITEEKGVYTNGGAMSFLNILIHLVEKYYDRETAIACAKLMEIDMDRNSQSPYIIFSGQKNHTDELIKKIQVFIENHPVEKISVSDLSEKFSIGRRNFDRRFKKATGNTPIEYVQRVKMESAKKNLELTQKNINEVMYDAGYSDVKAFRAVFKKITGLSPLAYRKKYNKETILT